MDPGSDGSGREMAPFFTFIASSCQVSVARVCWRYVLLLCRNVVRRRRHPRPLQQDDASLLHAASLQLPLLRPAALPLRSLSATPTAQVCAVSKLGRQLDVLRINCGL